MQHQANDGLEDCRGDWVNRGDVPAKQANRSNQYPDVNKLSKASRSGKGHGAAAHHVQCASAEPSTTCALVGPNQGRDLMEGQAAALKRKPAVTSVRGTTVAPRQMKVPRPAR